MWAGRIAFRLGGKARNQAAWALSVRNRETVSGQFRNTKSRTATKMTSTAVAPRIGDPGRYLDEWHNQRTGPKGDLNLIQITAPVQPGNCGGPLVDQYVRVEGVIVAKLDALEVAKVTGDIAQNVNFANQG